MTQQTLAFEPRQQTRQQRFEHFHRTHPEIYAYLREKSLALKAAGRTQWGVRNLYEKLRYDLAIQTGEQPYSLNDHYISFYARLLMEQEPELAGFFEIREPFRSQGQP